MKYRDISDAKERGSTIIIGTIKSIKWNIIING